ncbi:nitric oxide reductase transcriptional regulator NorR [Endozoicomonas lisbonensis]|uniref:Anaerobic nitric oxide reductase transcription regulator n=1 Tax=Endozoicomonas lisbonensis TaxID=3120522 RepID=A0ABV2SHX2_9GAMM
MADKSGRSLADFANIIESLTSDMTPGQRYQTLLSGLSGLFPCDATCLLKLDTNLLYPVASVGLSADARSRRFPIDRHPRFAEILASPLPVQFSVDSALPDPFDGLMATGNECTKIHNCIGIRLMVDGRIWGVLCLEALNTGAFCQMKPESFRTAVAIVTATIKMVTLIHQLEENVAYEHELNQRLLSSGRTSAPSDLIGESPAMKALNKDIEVVAGSGLAVLVQGETGTGKELVARKIHRLSDRNGSAMIQVNCASLPEHIVESELFGHVRGAFTGAVKDRQGKFRLADNGTIFLDEIGELPLNTQAKLLRVLQTGEVQPVGKDQLLKVNVRVIAATNRDLMTEVREGRFRSDLYHRLNAYPLEVPPLRSREGDILLLAGFFMELYTHRFHSAVLRLDEASKQLLQAYQWPGNVRELEHAINRAALKACHDQNTDRLVIITPEHLGLDSPAERINRPEQVVNESGDLRSALDTYQKQMITRLLNEKDNNWSEVARYLNMDRANLNRLAKRLGLK